VFLCYVPLPAAKGVQIGKAVNFAHSSGLCENCQKMKGSDCLFGCSLLIIRFCHMMSAASLCFCRSFGVAKSATLGHVNMPSVFFTITSHMASTVLALPAATDCSFGMADHQAVLMPGSTLQ
jgi:chorismate synthase